MKVACFGDSFSHTAAAEEQILRELGKAADTVYFDTVYDALGSVASGKCELAVVPIENSFEGTVTAAIDALDELGLYIVGECVLGISHALIALEGVTPEDIKVVYSHPQALSQCRSSLKKLLPSAKTEAVAYTSAALDRLDGRSAAVARKAKKGQVVLAEGIEDSAENSTRFVTVAASPLREGDKVSVEFSALDRPGALLSALKLFDEKGLNMTKIESRPAKKRLGQYLFFVDFGFDGDFYALGKLLDELSDRVADLRYLGRYPRYRAN